VAQSVAQGRPAASPAPAAAAPQPVPGGGMSADDLAELMRAFNSAAAQLQSTHEGLTAEVASLRSQLREANERLERSRRLAALGEMAAGIAHEVRNPLAAIALHAEMLRQDLTQHDQSGQHGLGDQAATADKILRAARELDGVVGDVLRFARELEPSPAPVDPAEPARRAIATCAMLADDAGVRLRLHAPACPPVSLDAGLIAQALSNLIRNAVEAIADRGAAAGPPAGEDAVDLAVTPPRGPAGRLGYTVSDTGPGLPEGLLERMFNPFFTTRQAGCGLGLAMVQRIVDAHGGRVDADSLTAGGARFTLLLPATQPDDNGGPA